MIDHGVLGGRQALCPMSLSTLAGAQAELWSAGSASAPMGKAELDLLVRECHGFERGLEVQLDVNPSQMSGSEELA